MHIDRIERKASKVRTTFDIITTCYIVQDQPFEETKRLEYQGAYVDDNRQTVDLLVITVKCNFS